MINNAAVAPLVESVLHPTDFSAASERAFAHALAISLLRQTEFTILHVSPGKMSRAQWARFPPVRQTMSRWGLLEDGSPRTAVYDEFNVKVRKVAVRGRHPVLATARFLDHDPTDLIVLATEARKGPSRWVNRSDAEAMARWSQTKTLFVPAHAKRSFVSLDDGELNLKNILVPIDRSPDPTAAVEFASRAAGILGEGEVVITLLHIGDVDAPTPYLPEGPGWTWLTKHRSGDVAEEILKAADMHVADLIVMATTGHDGVLDSLRGSTTEKVLRKAPCPLLAVPAR